MEIQNVTVPRQIVVFGANGGIGKQVVEQALDAGHQVTAILRTPSKLILTHPNLSIVQGDIMQANTFDEHLQNKEVVVSAIGKNSTKKTTLYSQGNKNLIDAMQRTGLKRAFFISSSGIDVNPTHSLLVRLATSYILQTILRYMYADQLKMEMLIKKSAIDWTIIRPPKLNDKEKTGKYRVSATGFLHNGLSISRADVAHFIVEHFDNKEIIGKTIEIAY